MPEERATPRLDALSAWSLVFVGNLVYPGLLGAGVVSKGGWFGMVLGIAALWAAGAVACARSARSRAALVCGGTVVALLQVVPVLHVLAGLAALGAWELLSGEGVDGGLSEAGGFFVTLATGQPLALLALLVGYVGMWAGLVQAPKAGADDEQVA